MANNICKFFENYRTFFASHSR